jgi:hypothetical protein
MKRQTLAVMPISSREVEVVKESRDMLSEADGGARLSQNAGDRMEDSRAGEGSERGDDLVRAIVSRQDM